MQVHYTLDSFIEFIGGGSEETNHFVAYKKVHGNWLKADDRTVSFANVQLRRQLYLIVYVRGTSTVPPPPGPAPPPGPPPQPQPNDKDKDEPGPDGEAEKKGETLV